MLSLESANTVILIIQVAKKLFSVVSVLVVGLLVLYRTLHIAQLSDN